MPTTFTVDTTATTATMPTSFTVDTTATRPMPVDFIDAIATITPDMPFLRPEDMADTYTITIPVDTYPSSASGGVLHATSAEEAASLMERIEELERRLDYLQDLISSKIWNEILGEEEQRCKDGSI